MREVFDTQERATMLLDWNGIEFDIIQDKAFLGCPNPSGLLPTGQVITITGDFPSKRAESIEIVYICIYVCMCIMCKCENVYDV